MTAPLAPDRLARVVEAIAAGQTEAHDILAAAPDLHLVEFRRHRTLLVVDEVHHLPSLADTDPAASAQAEEDEAASAWSRVMLPLLECAAVRLLLSGTLERVDGKGILWLPHRAGEGPHAQGRARLAGLGGGGLLAAAGIG